MNPKQALLHVLASTALLMTGVMTDPPDDEVLKRLSACCPMPGSTEVVCRRPAALPAAAVSARIR